MQIKREKIREGTTRVIRYYLLIALIKVLFLQRLLNADPF